MKHFSLLLPLLCLAACKEQNVAEKQTAADEQAVTETLTDRRDGKTYKTVKIGEQVWMAENLDYEAEGSVCYDNDPANCEKYGRLYNWATAKNVCPEGWHLPSNEEWEDLYQFADGSTETESPYESKTAGKFLKAKSGWGDYEGKSGNGTDIHGFAALPGGGCYLNGSFSNPNSHGNWWSASEFSSDYAYKSLMGYNGNYTSWSIQYKSYGFSVRCIKNSYGNGDFCDGKLENCIKHGRITYITLNSKTELSKSFNSTEHKETFYVLTDGNRYEIDKFHLPWCSTLQHPDFFVLTCEYNPNEEKRKGSLKITSGGKTAKITLHQKGAPLEILWRTRTVRSCCVD
jgi:uncharacterized protein (TIGR02145 family)